jgi:hypothetical protein
MLIVPSNMLQPGHSLAFEMKPARKSIRVSLGTTLIAAALISCDSGQAVEAPEPPKLSEAYIISQGFVQQQQPGADFPLEYQRGQVVGDGRYIVQSTATANGATSTYTARMKFNGGDWADPKNWTLTELNFN